MLTLICFYTIFTCYINKRQHITSCDLYSLLHVTASVWVKRNKRHKENGIEEKEDLHLRATRRSFPTKDMRQQRTASSLSRGCARLESIVVSGNINVMPSSAAEKKNQKTRPPVTQNVIELEKPYKNLSKLFPCQCFAKYINIFLQLIFLIN